MIFARISSQLRWGHDQLFDRAALAFPHDGKGSHARGGLEQDHGDQAGDNVISAQQIRVDRARECAHPLARPQTMHPCKRQLLDLQGGAMGLAGKGGGGKHCAAVVGSEPIDQDGYLAGFPESRLLL